MNQSWGRAMREVGSYPFVSDSSRLLSDKPLNNDLRGVDGFQKILKLANQFAKNVSILRKKGYLFQVFEKKKVKFFLLQG